MGWFRVSIIGKADSIDIYVERGANIIATILDKAKIHYSTSIFRAELKALEELPECEGCRCNAGDQRSHMGAGGCLEENPCNNSLDTLD